MYRFIFQSTIISKHTFIYYIYYNRKIWSKIYFVDRIIIQNVNSNETGRSTPFCLFSLMGVLYPYLDRDILFLNFYLDNHFVSSNVMVTYILKVEVEDAIIFFYLKKCLGYNTAQTCPCYLIQLEPTKILLWYRNKMKGKKIFTRGWVPIIKEFRNTWITQLS